MRPEMDRQKSAPCGTRIGCKQDPSPDPRRPTMSQATPTTLAAKVESLGEADLLPFHELLDAAMVDAALTAEKVRFNDCIYAPIVTLCLFLSQVIDPHHSCRASVARLIAWRVFRGLAPCDEDTGTYCEARKRLPTAVARR